MATGEICSPIIWYYTFSLETRFGPKLRIIQSTLLVMQVHFINLYYLNTYTEKVRHQEC